MYSLTVEVKSLKSRRWPSHISFRGSREIPFLSLPTSAGEALLGLRMHQSSLCLYLHINFSSSVGLSQTASASLLQGSTQRPLIQDKCFHSNSFNHLSCHIREQSQVPPIGYGFQGPFPAKHSTLCHVVLWLLPQRGGVNFLTSSIWTDLGTCLSQQNAAEVILCQFLAQVSRDLADRQSLCFSLSQNPASPQ